MDTITTAAPYTTSWEHLKEEMKWLDHLLSRRMKPEDLERGIRQRLEASAQADVHLTLPHLARTFHLSPFEERCILLCLAPAMDGKHGQPTVGQAIELLCSSPEEAVGARAAFDPGAPLIRGRLIHIADGPSTLLGRTLKLDDRIAELLLGSSSVAPALQGAAELVFPMPDRLADPELRQRLGTFIQARLGAEAGGITIHLHGPAGAGKKSVALAVCGDLGVRLVLGDAGRMLEAPRSFAETAWLFAREAVLQPAALCLTGFDRLLAEDGDAEQLRSLLAAVQVFSRLTFLLGERPWSGALSILSVGLGHPDAASARELWQGFLADQPVAGDVDAGALAGRFRLTPGQIRDAVTLAGSLAQWRSPGDGTITGSDLAAACRAQSGSELARVAAKIEPRYGWNDLVLPPDTLRQLREICGQARHRHVVLGEWGFDRRLTFGKGLNVLFSGPPGTGKTMAAEVLARALELDLYRIDLSRVVSKYIGETEKNLDRVFTAARSANAILFFDEADALFGKRSEVRDAHDRYANVEVSYLLQKMEEYEGISILASNLRQHLDGAFLRRLAFAVHFPFPDEENRRRIWEGAWPAEAPLAEDVDFAGLARELEIAGGNIKNIVLAAAFLAAAEAGRVRQSHLLWATRRELQKLGKTLELEEEAG